MSRGQRSYNPLILTLKEMVLERGAIRITLVQHLKGCGEVNKVPQRCLS